MKGIRDKDSILSTRAKEIQAMLQVHDIRQSRVWQEAKGEGMQEGIQEGIQGVAKERRRTISMLAAKRMTIQEIASLLDLDLEQVQKALESKDGK